MWVYNIKTESYETPYLFIIIMPGTFAEQLRSYRRYFQGGRMDGNIGRSGGGRSDNIPHQPRGQAELVLPSMLPSHCTFTCEGTADAHY